MYSKTYRVSAELKARIRALARQQGRTMSAIVREAIETYCRTTLSDEATARIPDRASSIPARKRR